MILGIDIGGTRIKAGLVDDDGALLKHAAVATPPALPEFTRALQALVRDCLGGASVTAVGFACKGIVDLASTVVVVLPGTLHYLQGHSLAEMVRPALGAEVPVVADNDARVALAGEVAWGAARGHANVVMVTLGTGVGGAVLSEGRILRGTAGVAGHIGHVVVDPRGPLCICGSRGCLETYFSARAIEFAAREGVDRGCVSSLTEEFATRSGELACADVFRAAGQGDEMSRMIVDEATFALAAALSGVLHVADPEILIVGGQISEAGDALLKPLAEEIHRRTRCLLNREVPVILPQVLDRSGIVGAAALAKSAL
jgi:glucokinase